jgi:hypothetical protein
MRFNSSRARHGFVAPVFLTRLGPHTIRSSGGRITVMIDHEHRAAVLACLILAALAVPAAGRAASPQGEDVRPLFEVTNAEYETFHRAALPGESNGASAPEPELRLSTARVAVNLPTPLGARTTLIHGLYYSYLHAEYWGFDSAEGPARPGDLHAAGYTLTVLRKISSSWLLRLGGGPEVASDFQNLDHDQLKVRGRGLLDHRIRRSVVWGLGAAYTDVTGRPQVLPVFHVLLNPGGRARAEILVPYRGQATVTLIPGLDLGIAARLEGDRYRIGRSGAGRNSVVRYSTASFGPSLELETMSGMYLRLDAGEAFERTFEIRDPNDDAVLEKLNPENVFFLRGGLSFKI